MIQINKLDIAKKMKAYCVKGVSVSIIKEDKLASVNNYGVIHNNLNLPVDDMSVFNACSISKIATTLLTLKLVSDGLLHLDKNVNDQMKSWKVSENEYTKTSKVTLRSLLCHQGGFVDPDGSFGTYNSTFSKLTMTKLLNGQTPYYPIRAEVKYEPFTQCIYSDLGYCIIELLISDVLSMPYKQAINRFIFEPLHMKDSWIIDNPQDFNHQNFSWGHTKSGLVINRNDLVYPFSAAAGLWCTSKDLALILIEINRQIQGKGKLKINQNIFLELIKLQGCKDWSGLGFFLDVVDKQVELSSYGWGVGFQCMLVNYPIEGNGVVIMTNTDTKTHQMKGFIGEIISAMF